MHTAVCVRKVYDNCMAQERERERRRERERERIVNDSYQPECFYWRFFLLSQVTSQVTW